MGEYTADDLKKLQKLSLEQKIRWAEKRIKWWYEAWKGQVYVSFSGGKDSTVLLDIVRRMYPDVEAVFCDTGLEYPEIRDFVKSKDNVAWLRPEMNFRQVIKQKGYPVVSKAVSHAVSVAKRNPNGAVKRNMFNPDKKGQFAMHKWEYLIDAPFEVSDKCCDIMKKKPVHKFSRETGKKAIIGTMACESSMRRAQWMKNGCNAFDTEYPTSHPLSIWTEQDILEYIYTYKIPYASVYGEIKQDCKGKYFTTGESRTGCMFCMFGAHLEKEPNRFQRMKETHPSQYDYCIRDESLGGLGLGKVLDYLGVDYE